MKNQKEIKKIVRQIVKNYKPEKIILFGSFARGKPVKDSDVDLFIIKKTKKDPLKRCYEVRKILDASCPLDILVYNPREIKKRLRLGDFFLKEIIDHGEVIYKQK